MKRNNPNEKTLPDMGKIVSNLLDNKHMNHVDVAKKLGWSEPAMTKLLKKRNWNMYELREVGKAADENLFLLCQTAPTEPMLPAKQVEEGLKREQRLESELNKVKEELKIMAAKYDGAMEVIEKLRK